MKELSGVCYRMEEFILKGLLSWRSIYGGGDFFSNDLNLTSKNILNYVLDYSRGLARAIVYIAMTMNLTSLFRKITPNFIAKTYYSLFFYIVRVWPG
jgi:hypothetical protein